MPCPRGHFSPLYRQLLTLHTMNTSSSSTLSFATHSLPAKPAHPPYHCPNCQHLHTSAHAVNLTHQANSQLGPYRLRVVIGHGLRLQLRTGAFIAAPQVASKSREFQGLKDIEKSRELSSVLTYTKLCVKKIYVTWSETASLPSGERPNIIVLLLLFVEIYHFKMSILRT